MVDESQLRSFALEMARGMLFESWRRRQEVEEQESNFLRRTPLFIPAPTVDEILTVAAELHSFVQPIPVKPG